ncbi:MAG: MSCRAMM family protein, partial [Candidatus Promineifilaceae bacterium]
DTVLVVDRTGSMGSGGLFPAAMTAVNMFIAAAAQDGIDQNPNNPLWHQVGVASFNTQGTLDNPLTWDLANLVPTVSAPDGSTAIETGLNVGIAHLSDFNFRNPNAQPVIILLSDGGNTNAASDTWTANAATAATAAGIRLVTIAYGTGAPSTLLQSITPNPGDFYQAGAVNIDQILANIVSTLCTGDVSGQKFHDQNANGLWDSNEPPLEGWVFTLLDSAGIPVDSAVSGPDGTYTFEDVAIGSYTIVETGQPDWFQTFPPDGAGHQVVVTPGDNLTGFDFGNTECPTCGEISGIKWNDLNGNGVQDAGEPPLAGFNFILVDSNGESAGFATSGSDGSFTFPDLSADIYTIIELAQPNWVQTFPADGMPHVVSLEAGESITGVDFGNQECACGTISGYKWEDQNNNGVWDSGEPVLDGFTFLLLDANNNLVEMVTSNANGYYEFSDLPPGTYIVSEQAMGGWALTSPQTGSHTITIGFGEHSMDNNFGNYRCGDDQCGSGAVLVPTIKGLEKLMPGSKGHMTVSIKNEGEATRGTPSVVLPLATGFQAIERSWADNGWKCTASEASVTCVYSDVIERSAETQVSIPMMATREAQSTMLCAYAGAVNDLHPQDNFACTLVNFGDTRK